MVRIEITRTSSIWVVVAVIFSLGTPSLWGSRWSFSYPRLEPHAIPKVVARVQAAPIASGCELRGCCPGCIPSSHLDWKIRLEGPAFTSLRLQPAEGQPPTFAGIKCSGAVTEIDTGFMFTPGESVCENVPVLIGDQTPIVFPWLAVDPQALSGDPSFQGEGILIIEQILNQASRQIVVNSFVLNYLIRERYTVGTSIDFVDTTGSVGTGQPTILADFNVGVGGVDDCKNDLIFESITPPVPIGNATADGGCNSEVSVFSLKNAMSFQPKPFAWTAATGETYTAPLTPMISVPVNVYLATSMTAPQVKTLFDNTNDLFSKNRVGVQFDHNCTSTCTDVSSQSALIGLECSEKVDDITKDAALFVPGRLNVYFVDSSVPNAKGYHCGYAQPSESNIIYIPSNGSAPMLAHELGHALGLSPDDRGGHSNCIASSSTCHFSSDNIMWAGGGNTRDTFSLGQVYRMNLHHSSMLNVNGNRNGITRYCEPRQGMYENDKFCPPIWWPGSP